MKSYLIFLIFLITCQTAEAAKSVSRNFDNANDEIDWGDVNNTTTGNRSFCVWAKQTEDAESDVLLGKKNTCSPTNTSGYCIQQDSDDTPSCYVSDNTDAVSNTSSTLDIDGLWNMLCCTWTASSEALVFYVNGAQEDSDTGGGSIDSLTTTAEFASGEDGSEAGDANGVMGWFLTGGDVWTAIQINNLRWHPESRAAMAGIGGTHMNVPAWTGASPEIDINNLTDGTPSNSGTNTDGPPIMIGALGASY